MRRPGACTHELAMNAFLAPNMTLPGAREAKAANWSKDAPGRVWHTRDAAGTQVWTRRGASNVFDVTGCGGGTCGGKTLTILRAGDRVMVLRPGTHPADAFVYLGIMTGGHVSGWYPGGPWQAGLHK